jgi:hypothetical protein
MEGVMTLEELFEHAMQYGNVNVHQCEKDRTFSVNIKFMTAEHIRLEAHSGFRCPTIRDGLVRAIKKAEEIVGTTRSLSNIPKLEAKP